jgi:hypothetical protein
MLQYSPAEVKLERKLSGARGIKASSLQKNLRPMLNVKTPSSKRCKILISVCMHPLEGAWTRNNLLETLIDIGTKVPSW